MYAAGRVDELLAAGDLEGVETWRAIAVRIDQLMDYRTGRPLTQQ